MGSQASEAGGKSSSMVEKQLKLSVVTSKLAKHQKTKIIPCFFWSSYVENKCDVF